MQRNGLSLQSEDKFRAIFEGTNDGILVADGKTRKFILANSRICEITGYSQEELLKLNVNSIHPKKDLPHVISEFTKLLQKKIITAKGIPVLRKGKGVVYCDINSKIVKIGGRECLVGFFRDITERKQMEDELRKSEQKHRFLMDNIDEIVLIISKTGNIVFANNKALKTFGYSSEEIIGKSIVSFLTKRSIKKAMYALAQEFMGKHQAEMDVEARTKSGEIRTLGVAPSSIPVYEKGKMVGIQVNCSDITERMKAEEALREREEMYRLQFEEAIDAIFIADAKTGILVNCNRAATRLVERDKSEIIGQHQSILHPPEKTRGEFTNTFKKHMKEAEGQTLEAKVITKSGKLKDVAIKANFIELGGKKYLHGIFSDITERMKADEAVKQSEQKLSQIIQGSSVATFVIDKNHKVIYWNSACKNLTGIPAERMIGKDVQWSAFYKEKRSLLADLIVDGAKESEINKLYEGTSRKSQVLQGAYEAERFLPKLGKSGRWLLFTAAPLKNSKGQITGAIETLQDITERKGVEEELKESEERHRILYESSWDAIMTLAPPSWLFTSGNPATVKLFGARSEKEFITKGLWDVSPECQPDGIPSSDKSKKMIEKAMKEDSNFFEWTHKKLSGEDFPATVLLTRMKIKDQTFLQATVRDITEQKKAEEELKSKVEELERFNKLAVGRELKMIELKKRIGELEKAGK
ncbi:MAG: PAS domain S-box protein [Candidatus Aenigmarchaeota archaeon]|nr:PAS domain S-box protein [Candidatus Aenigmarchaeota archaeon]